MTRNPKSVQNTSLTSSKQAQEGQWEARGEANGGRPIQSYGYAQKRGFSSCRGTDYGLEGQWEARGEANGYFSPIRAHR